MANRVNMTTRQSVSTSVSPNVAGSPLTPSSSSSRSRSVSLLQTYCALSMFVQVSHQPPASAVASPQQPAPAENEDMQEFDAGEFAFNKILSHLQEDGQPAEYLVDFEDYEPEFVEADAFEGCLGVLHAYHRQARVKANLDDPVSQP